MRYLVVEWTTISTPNSSGRCRYGDMKVLSQTTRAPARCAISLTSFRSVTIITGLVGVSRNTILVFGLIAASTLSGSEVSTKSNSML